MAAQPDNPLFSIPISLTQNIFYIRYLYSGNAGIQL